MNDLHNDEVLDNNCLVKKLPLFLEDLLSIQKHIEGLEKLVLEIEPPEIYQTHSISTNIANIKAYVKDKFEQYDEEQKELIDTRENDYGREFDEDDEEVIMDSFDEDDEDDTDLYSPPSEDELSIIKTRFL